MGLIVLDHLAPGVWRPLVDDDGCLIFFDNPTEAVVFARLNDVVDPYVTALGGDVG